MEDLCRTCGELPQNSCLRNIFKEVVLLELIKEFTGLQLRNKEKLPVYICNRCYNMLKEMFNFKQRCILVQNSFDNERIKESNSTKVRSTKIKIEQPSDSVTDIIEPTKYLCEYEEYLDNDIDSDVNILTDLEESDQEQEDLIGQHDATYESAEELFNEITYGEAQDACEEVGNGIDDINDEMANSEYSYLDEIELFGKDADDNDDDAIDEALESIPDELNETVINKKKRKPYDRKHLERNYICEVCGKIFTRNENLKQHLYTHNTVKAFKCSHCNKGFNSSCERKRHERLHSESNPYGCSYCPASFTHPSGKIRHEKIHTNKRPHKCSYCEKTFIDRGSLKDHETTHTRIRKYHCDICGHWSLTAKQLKIHCNSKAHKQNELHHNLRIEKKELEDSKHAQEA